MIDMDGGYDDIYQSSDCVWGRQPGSLLQDLSLVHCNLNGAAVLDVGCGEGKNAIHFARLGARVDAFDVSEVALRNAIRAWPDSNLVEWHCCGVDDWIWRVGYYDLVIAYGVLHCLTSSAHIQRTVEKIQMSTRSGGANVLCAFNDRRQDLRPHPGLNPTLLGHTEYRGMYANWALEVCTDSDLWETHPHNRIRHCHSLTRIIARKPL